MPNTGRALKLRPGKYKIIERINGRRMTVATCFTEDLALSVAEMIAPDHPFLSVQNHNKRIAAWTKGQRRELNSTAHYRAPAYAAE